MQDRQACELCRRSDDQVRDGWAAMMAVVSEQRLHLDGSVLDRRCQVTVDRNLSTMHRAGADFVLSYASAGATEVWNSLRGDSTVLLAEGLVMFRVAVPHRLTTQPLRETHIPRETGCYIIGVGTDGEVRTDIDLDEPLPAGSDIILIGTDEGEERFLRRYVAAEPERRVDWLWRLAGR